MYSLSNLEISVSRDDESLFGWVRLNPDNEL